MLPRPCRAVLALTAAAALHLVAAAPCAAAVAAAAAQPGADEPKQTSKPDPKTSKSDPKSSATKPDPKASKSATKPDPKASKSDAKPDPKASKSDAKPDPKASKSDAKPSATADPKAKSDPKPDPKPSKDPKASKSEPKPDPKASKSEPKPDPKASKSEPKPDPKASKSAPKPDPKTSAPPPPSAPAPPVPPASLPTPAASDGYWLGAHLLGPAAAQAAATAALAAGLPPEPAAAGAIGRAASLPEAVQWVARWAFAGDPLPAPAPADTALHTGPAPLPGGALYTAHRVVLHSLTITGRSADGGTRPIRWPQTSAEILPPGLPWLPAVLLAERAPLFAAPAAHVPPASERHALVRRSGSLFILGHLDHCTAATGERVCTRWAQVVARDGDSFRGGYLPAFQVARVDGWIRGAGQNPRAQLLIAGTKGSHAQFVLIARTRDGNLHRRTVLAPMTGDTYPAARLRVDGEWATIDFTGSAQQRIALDPGMDARVR